MTRLLVNFHTPHHSPTSITIMSRMRNPIPIDFDDEDEEEDWSEDEAYFEQFMGKDEFGYRDESLDDGFDDEPEEAEVDLAEIAALARRKLIINFACTLSAGSGKPINLFFSEAELYMSNGDYHSALVAAVAADQLVCETHRSIRREAIETICLYQLGARGAALDKADLIEQKVANSKEVSVYLKKRFGSTVEVLRFMPQLLGMLSSMKGDKGGQSRRPRE